MNIVGENFPEEIVKQIGVRQSKKGAKNRNPEGDPSILVWQNANTGWVKMVSSVNVNTEERIKVSNIEMAKSIQEKGGSKLAQEYVLFGGVYAQGLGRDGLRSGITRSNTIHSDSAYGIGGTDYGILPMPGITSFNIKTETRGSLKTATIGIKAFNRYQFDIINTLYMSLGYSILIEWGNTMYYDNSENLKSNDEINQFSLADDFLNGKLKWNDILPKIQENRIKSCGNYDASLGKVVNFSWTLNRDLSYDITLTVRTIGDVIESLKMNALSGYVKLKGTPTPLNNPKEGETPPEEKPADIINKYAYTSDVGAIFYNLMLELQSNNIKQEGNDVVATKISFNDGSTTDHYYIRFGYFLKELEDKIIYSLKPATEPPSKIIKFDYDIESNIILLYDRQISANPNVCIFKRKFYYSNGQTCDIFPQLNDFTLKGSGSPYTSFYGKLMNVYFDMTFILSELESLKNNDGSVVLIDLLNSLANGFNSSTGNFNKLSPTVNEDNKIVFIDDVPLPDKNAILNTVTTGSTKDAFFSLYGYYNTPDNKPLAGIVRNLSLTTTVSPNLATMITIGAQANGYVTGQDSTALSTMNLGLTDRVKQEWVEPLKPTSTTSEPTQSLEQKYATEISSYNKFIQEMGSNTWNQDDIDAFSNSISSFAEYDQASKTLKERQTNPTASSPNIGFLPFDLTLEIDGLSGMKVYQKFITDTEFLPSNYPQSLEFLIKGIKNEIKDNQWVTTIESLAIPKNPFGKKEDFNVGAPTTGQASPTQRAAGAAGTPRPGNFTTNASYPNVKFQNIGLGNPAGDRINANLLSDVSKAAQQAGVTVSITTAVSGHHSNPPSRHTSGNAVDVSIIDGIPVRPDASNRNKIDAFVAALQSLGYVKNAERGNPKAVLTFGFPNHNDHVHISNRA